eukprot:COSAG01_NODE_3748_length_5737_cov_64.443597_5_plen_386_part_00
MLMAWCRTDWSAACRASQPNDNFWKGSQQDYFALYNASAVALKNVSSKLRVGGPATNGPAVWVPEFVAFCENHSVPYDFVSSHLYAGGREGRIADVDVVVAGVAQAQTTVQGTHRPWLVTEWSADATANNWRWSPKAQYHETPASAAFILACVDAVLANTTATPSLRPYILSYWVFTDVFQEGGFPTVNASFHGGFGLLNIFGVEKPSFKAFELLANLTGRRVPMAAATAAAVGTSAGDPFLDGGSGDAAACTQQVRALTTWDPQSSALQVLVANHRAQLGNSTPAVPCNVTLRVHTAHRCTAVVDANLRRIDEQHANPRQTWIDMGMPQYPSRAQNEQIAAASHMPPLLFAHAEGVIVDNGDVVARVSVPAYGVAALNISLRCA